MTLNIATTRYYPFAAYPRDWDFEDTSKAHGFIFALIELIQAKLGFKAKFLQSKDGNYGSEVNGSWNGFVKMLLDKDADMVAAGFSLTAKRSTGDIRGSIVMKFMMTLFHLQ